MVDNHKAKKIHPLWGENELPLMSQLTIIFMGGMAGLGNAMLFGDRCTAAILGLLAGLFFAWGWLTFLKRVENFSLAVMMLILGVVIFASAGYSKERLKQIVENNETFRRIEKLREDTRVSEEKM